ncbi:filamentous hemagglutinin N-terminal domain-containing protein [Moorena sp. SIO1F2]|uniref:filamentous hemagglutinin N-terminal domain-containing protein n=1 Tax=Moorena sp. SIO1F2 TaxID=2607819 RepID=UPI0025E0E7C5|nr:filamentous hemagglutinin N-terminal domain-containing protein [Moorena sp. SIO1F2]
MNQTIQRCYLLGHLLVSSLLIPNIATAQISSDGTLSTTVTSDDGVNFLIEKGVRTWDHLFHSFSEFSVPSNGSAFFNNAGDIVNIFSRVTGGNISNIDGLIRANGNANLFLINPAGIIFGENASLNIGGSFFATTAESVVFGDGIEFSATEPNQAPLLTIILLVYRWEQIREILQ